MTQNVYSSYERRRVAPPEGFDDTVAMEIADHDDDVQQEIFMLIEELEDTDPEVDERCGLLAERHEVYAMRVPGHRGKRLALSVDRLPGSHRVLLHGIVPSHHACATARRLAVRQLRLIDPIWED